MRSLGLTVKDPENWLLFLRRWRVGPTAVENLRPAVTIDRWVWAKSRHPIAFRKEDRTCNRGKNSFLSTSSSSFSLFTYLSIEDTVGEEDGHTLECGEEEEKPLYHSGRHTTSHHKESQNPCHSQDWNQDQRSMDQSTTQIQEKTGMKSILMCSVSMTYTKRQASSSFLLVSLTMTLTTYTKITRLICGTQVASFDCASLNISFPYR